MKRLVLILIAAAASACSTATPEMRVVQDAVTAIGGADRLRAVNSIVVEGTGENYNLGQNMAPDAPLPVFRVTEYKRTYDLAGGRGLLDQTRVPQYVTANTAPQKQVFGVDGTVGYNVGADGTQTRVAELAATDRRIELWLHPVAILKAALAEGTTLANARKDGANDVVDVTAGGVTFTLTVDGSSRLPQSVSAVSYNVNLGDVALRADFSDYKDADGLKVPGRIVWKTDTYTTADIQVATTAVNGPVPDLAATAASKAAAAPALTANVTADEVAPGIWYLAGQSHHSILVEFADHLTLIEAPQNEVRTAAVIQKVREIKKDKPLRNVIATHHHFDHSGGLRAAISEGLTVIGHDKMKGFVDDIASRKHSVIADALAKAAKPATFEGVAAKKEIKDASRTIEIYPIEGSAHAETLLMVYFPAERLLVQADVYSPPAPDVKNPPPAPFAPNLLENIRKNNLRVDRILPIHGRMIPMRDLEAAAAAASKKTE